MWQIIKNAWQGKEKLWKMFYLYTLIGYTVFASLAYVINVIKAQIDGLPNLWIFFIAFVPYFLWSFISLWRCALNTNIKFFGYLVRTILIILIIIQVYYGNLFAGFIALVFVLNMIFSIPKRIKNLFTKNA